MSETTQNAAATAATTPAEKVVENVNVMVMYNSFGSYDDKSQITLHLDKPIPQYKTNRETGVVELVELPELTFGTSVLTAQLSRVNPIFAGFRNSNAGKLTEGQYGVLTAAKLTVSWYKVATGEEYTENGETKVADKDKIIKNITKCVLSPEYEELAKEIIKENLKGLFKL